MYLATIIILSVSLIVLLVVRVRTRKAPAPDRNWTENRRGTAFDC